MNGIGGGNGAVTDTRIRDDGARQPRQRRVSGLMATALPVAVIGAGAAGLAAAFKLKQAGLTVTIIEAAPVVGGKLRSRERDGFVLDEGAFFFPTTHRRMLALAGEAGFASQIEPGGGVIAVTRAGAYHHFDTAHVVRDFFATQLFSTATKLSLLSLAAPMLQARNCSFERIPGMARFDVETADAWARRSLSPELVEYAVGLIMRGMSGVSVEEASYVEFPSLLALLMGARLVACRGGMGAYAGHLAVGCEVNVSASARQIEATGNAVRVTWHDRVGNERNDEFAGCVIATSPDTTTQIHPALDSWRRDYLGRTRDKHSFSILLGLSRPPDALKATYLLVPQSVHPFLCGICADHHKAAGRVPAGKGLLSLMPVYEWCEAHQGDGDEQIIASMIEALEQVVPGVSSTIEFAELVRWKQRYNPLGHYRDLGRFRAQCERDDTRIQLAGDYFAFADVESAICSGERAARELIKTLVLT